METIITKNRNILETETCVEEDQLESFVAKPKEDYTQLGAEKN